MESDPKKGGKCLSLFMPSRRLSAAVLIVTLTPKFNYVCLARLSHNFSFCENLDTNVGLKVLMNSQKSEHETLDRKFRLLPCARYTCCS